jgi:hypothetical protein
VTWRISAAWAQRPHDCTASGIAARCHGGCCTAGPSGLLWPGRAGEGGRCVWLGPAGCSLSAGDRPVGCLLYPFRLNANGTLVLHHATTRPSSICRGNHGLGPPAIDALRGSLVELLGAEQYARARAEVMAGRDALVEPPPEVLAALAQERSWEAENLPPEPRGPGSGRQGEQPRPIGRAANSGL